MKKIILSLTVLIALIAFSYKVEAKTFTVDTYGDLNIISAMIVGDYIFNLDEGFSPSLEDILIASRTIPDEQPTTLYSVMYLPGFYYSMEIYTGQEIYEESKFRVFPAKYVYRTNIRTAVDGDYDIL